MLHSGFCFLSQRDEYGNVRNLPSVGECEFDDVSSFHQATVSVQSKQRSSRAATLLSTAPKRCSSPKSAWQPTPSTSSPKPRRQLSHTWQRSGALSKKVARPSPPCRSRSSSPLRLSTRPLAARSSAPPCPTFAVTFPLWSSSALSASCLTAISSTTSFTTATTLSCTR